MTMAITKRTFHHNMGRQRMTSTQIAIVNRVMTATERACSSGTSAFLSMR